MAAPLRSEVVYPDLNEGEGKCLEWPEEWRMRHESHWKFTREVMSASLKVRDEVCVSPLRFIAEKTDREDVRYAI